MAGASSNDPAAMWRDMVTQWEKGMNALTTQFMGTDEFSRDMNRVMSASMRMQKVTQEMLGRYFEALNIPTKDDLEGLGERMHTMEEQLDRIERAVELLAGPDSAKPGAPPRVPRTKRFQEKEEGQA